MDDVSMQNWAFKTRHFCPTVATLGFKSSEVRVQMFLHTK